MLTAHRRAKENPMFLKTFLIISMLFGQEGLGADESTEEK